MESVGWRTELGGLTAVFRMIGARDFSGRDATIPSKISNTILSPTAIRETNKIYDLYPLVAAQGMTHADFPISILPISIAGGPYNRLARERGYVGL